ncbi:DUF3800 domain-containing protein [Leptolyngbya sp. BC1307]|uniref:DUF3800 domain-containing protein n=1 Tax=Leptolyngbya sp. BC1307 TaxID=2029589 RepID=UPI000EFA95D6|nr:DUF3800 domain-containing protein [Leptolyngbya sp. BC1307]
MTAENTFMFIDETGVDRESKILAIACVITKEARHLRDKLNQLRNEIVKDRLLKDISDLAPFSIRVAQRAKI